MSKKQAQLPLTKLLRDALRECESVRAVARAAGLSQPSLVLFLAGRQSLRLDKGEALMQYFGIRVLPPKPTRRKKG